MPTREQALPGRPERPFAVSPLHVVLGTPLEGPWPEGSEVLHVAMGCFWGVERIYWQQPGVIVTAAGYMGGFTPNPTYAETTTGMTGHAETVRVVYDPALTTPENLLKVFWENHDATQGARQGNDIGTTYRSAIYWTTPGQGAAAHTTKEVFQRVLRNACLGEITTEIRRADGAGEFYLAEDEHQGYLHKNPGGYCNHGPNGLVCPVGPAPADEDDDDDPFGSW